MVALGESTCKSDSIMGSWSGGGVMEIVGGGGMGIWGMGIKKTRRTLGLPSFLLGKFALFCDGAYLNAKSVVLNTVAEDNYLTELCIVLLNSLSRYLGVVDSGWSRV